MKQFFKDFQIICTTFTMVTLSIALYGIFTGSPDYLSLGTIFTTLFLIILLDVSTHLLNLLPFHSKATYQISRFLLQFGLFVLLLGALYRFSHISLREWLPRCILIYLLIYAILTVYYQKKAKLDAEEINRLLAKRNAN